MRTIYLVRHSQRNRQVTDEMTAPLTEEGIKLAEDYCSLLPKGLKVYSSPYKRATQTIAFYDPNPILIDDLREREVGSWLLNFDEYTQKQWLDKTYKLKQGESLEEVTNRIIPLFNQLLKNNSEDFIINSHGTLLACLLAYLTKGGFNYSDFKEMGMPDVYLVRLDNQGELVELKKVKK